MCSWQEQRIKTVEDFKCQNINLNHTQIFTLVQHICLACQSLTGYLTIQKGCLSVILALAANDCSMRLCANVQQEPPAAYDI